MLYTNSIWLCHIIDCEYIQCTSKQRCSLLCIIMVYILGYAASALSDCKVHCSAVHVWMVVVAGML